ncbi:ribonucleotide-diphosphate reductase subunit beta [Bacillus atrophaeus]|uniref:ribonucleotide-diphosphate reductase subunit beta n=1 Tax=Bacillus atrophaeus TaxID=1452 RepID=UPI00227DB81C|nr:ribonucleotide-diphosphate reductase subunit beta [Bacillus atrophaeus]MCY7866030.1 ribonucleotide-diphosphate reductase subunit beta [Bacillus spizizenii]MCY8890408.1 ribonucleotide-diphosphate reductase subunit beta [Bacillus spizizenii]MEC0841863.1 ribonucleotide-diphosphate reductase subunit beta [Bacillus spizizenii]MED1125245.1 ribonucleotide-diphosphate reductase subunit beta [Bacillus atrophaeus]
MSLITDIHAPLKPVVLMDVTKPNRSTGIVGGETSGLLNLNDMAYPQMFELQETLLANFWKPSDINMQDDIKKWDTLLESEQIAFLRANTALAGLDSLQTPTMVNVMNVLSDSVFRLITAIIAQQEGVHTVSYSYVLSSLVELIKQNKAFDDIKKDPIITKRNKFILDVYQEFLDHPSVYNLYRLLVQSINLEGIYFYAGFAFFYYLASKQKMMKTATMISYIQKDEMQHAWYVAQVIRILLDTVPELNTQANLDYARDSICEAVELEKEWAADLLKDIDVDINEFNDYIEYLGNKRVRQIGLSNIYPERNNVMPWISVYDDSMISNTKTDQFENTSRNYTMVNSDNGFDEL